VNCDPTIELLNQVKNSNAGERTDRSGVMPSTKAHSKLDFKECKT
jgi:hypothetical protein